MEATTFTVGVNLPWVRYGCDFGANAWQPAGGLTARDDLDGFAARLREIASAGLELVRWFVLADGRAGIRFAPDGTPLGTDACFFDDFDLALRLVTEAGLRVVPVLFDFHWCLPARFHAGVSMGGRRDVLADPLKRAALVDRVVRPLLERYGGHPAVAAWDLFNEPEWIALGLGRWNPLVTVEQADLRDLFRGLASMAHRVGAHPVSVGSASIGWLSLVQGVGLDFYQTHWYDALDARAPLDRPIAALRLDRPVLLGEFPTRGSRRRVATILDTALQAGYAGALAWSVMSDDGASDPRAAVWDTAEWAGARRAKSVFANRGGRLD